jgi:hypothetical protein
MPEVVHCRSFLELFDERASIGRRQQRIADRLDSDRGRPFGLPLST